MMAKLLFVVLGLTILNCDWVSSRKIHRRTGTDKSHRGLAECHGDQWKCGDGACILSTWKCDQKEDCGDGSDESNCDYECEPPFDFKCGTGGCIYDGFVCDGDSDCADGSDELECGGCHSDQWKCGDGACILSTWKCDQKEDCGDGSDESNCDYECEEPFDFQCGTGGCIYDGFVCDGSTDCADGSDELNCTYELVRNRVTQEQARTECASRGKTLLQVDDLEEQMAVTRLLESNYVTEYVWTDGKRENTACRCLFTWITSGLPVRFTYWRLDAAAVTTCQPDNFENSEHCIHLVPEAGWQWNDINCEDEYYFICE